MILVTLHVIFGDRAADRLAELKEIALWMHDWAERTNRYDHNLITLGDFSIDRQGSDGYDQFIATGLTVPDVLIDLPRTIFDDPGDSSDDNFYDQIAWFTSGRRALINMHLNRGENFDFLPYLYQSTSRTRTSVSFRVSGHYPLWVEFLLS